MAQLAVVRKGFDLRGSGSCFTSIADQAVGSNWIDCGVDSSRTERLLLPERTKLSRQTG